MSCGRNDEAKKVIQRCARSQKRILKEDLWTRVVEHEEKKVRFFVVLVVGKYLNEYYVSTAVSTSQVSSV